MIINRIIRNFLLFLFALYYALNWLYSTGSVISQICIVTIILISGVYFIKTLLLNDKNSLFYNAWTLLILLNIIGFIFNPDLSEGRARDMFKNILGGMLPFYPFYYFAKKDILNSTHLIRFFLIIMPVIILQFFKIESTILIEMDTDNTNVVNNMAYSFVSLIPYVFLVKRKKLLSGGLMIIIILFIIQGAKRGAIIVGSIGLLMYFYYLMITIEKRQLILGSMAVIIIFLGLSVFAYKTLISNEFLIGRMTSVLEGDLSGRNIIYKTIFSKWYNCNNIFNLVFGFGFAASVKIAGDYAHNDWLELLSNFGVLGICAYLFLFYAAAKYCLSKVWLIDKRVLMITITLMWFFTSLFSMSYASLGGFMQAILLGYLIGNRSESLV